MIIIIFVYYLWMTVMYVKWYFKCHSTLCLIKNICCVCCYCLILISLNFWILCVFKIMHLQIALCFIAIQTILMLIAICYILIVILCELQISVNWWWYFHPSTLFAFYDVVIFLYLICTLCTCQKCLIYNKLKFKQITVDSLLWYLTMSARIERKYVAWM